MLETIYASRYIRQVKTGRTKPVIIECEMNDGDAIEIYTKYSAGTMQKVYELAMEALCGMLARDLGLPVPSFFAVKLSDDFIDTIKEAEIHNSLKNSDMYAFGSKSLPTGFAAWPPNEVVPESLCELAAEIYTFDAIVINGDRRPDNPNCLTSGNDLAIIDHELCFTTELFWRAPWEQDGFNTRKASNTHIFAKPRLTTCPTNLDRLKKAWDKIDSTRITSYFSALPRTWAFNKDDEIRIHKLILNARNNIEEVIHNALEALR